MPFVIHSPIFFKVIMPSRYNAICLFPFILVKTSNDVDNQLLIQHELIHHRQQLELLIIPFYIIYLFEFLYNLIKLRDSSLAYMAISFEREAYLNQHKKAYLKNRKFWAMWRSKGVE